MPSKEHWEHVYSTKSVDAVSWYQAHAELSVQLIKDSGLATTAAIIDIGGGASMLVDDLLERDYGNLTVLDLSASALAAAGNRLGERAGRVHWKLADITRDELLGDAYDLWHDRAVFHFLTAPEDRQAYLRSVLRSLKPGGHVMISTFAEDGPGQCSGLPVMRYSADGLHREFGGSFTLVRHGRELHHTPFATIQPFTWCHFRKSMEMPAWTEQKTDVP